MNADQLKGKWMQFKGDLKGKWGKFTDNDLEEIAGIYDKFVGKVQKHYGERRANAWHAQSAPEAGKK